MYLARAAQEVLRHSDPVTWPAVGLAAVAAAGSWLSIVYGRRRARWANNGPKPGESETCREHGEAIATLTKGQETTETSLLRIERKVDQILLRGRG